MNEEYLWSKKGSDGEIEKLETLLSDFRFKEGSSPELVADNIIQIKPTVTRRFAWLTALGATATAAVLVGMWAINIPEKRVAESQTLPPVKAVPVEKPVEYSPTRVINVVESEQLPTLESLRTPRTVKTVYRTHGNSRITSSTVASKPKLTREEKYAYDRLMLALSITSSKLKVVQDTIDRKADLDQRSIRNDK